MVFYAGFSLMLVGWLIMIEQPIIKVYFLELRFFVNTYIDHVFYEMDRRIITELDRWFEYHMPLPGIPIIIVGKPSYENVSWKVKKISHIWSLTWL